MTNLTLALDEDLLRQARKAALDRDTTVNALVRGYLADLVQQRDQRQAALARLSRAMKSERLEVGARTWKRADLYER